jgi:hypothetical protein
MPTALLLPFQATAGGTKGVITLCEAGGTLKPTTNFPFGKASRSLQAAFRWVPRAPLALIATFRHDVIASVLVTLPALC